MSLELTVKFLGTGTITSGAERSCTSICLELPKEKILLDMGCGTLQRIARENIDVHRVNYIFLTHFHPDHISDLIPFLFLLRNSPKLRNTKKLNIWGPQGLFHFIKGAEIAYGHWVRDPSNSYKFNELTRRLVDFPGFRVIWNKVIHKHESVGYRFEMGGQVICFSGDSGYCQELIRLCNKADIAILECSHADEYATEGHLSPSLAAQIARAAAVKKLILTHFYPDALRSDILSVAKKYYSGEIILAEDGLKVTLPVIEDKNPGRN